MRNPAPSLNLDPHFHTPALDGIYVEDSRGELIFRRVCPPSDAEVARIADRVRRSVARLMERRGLGPHADPDESKRRNEEPLELKKRLPALVPPPRFNLTRYSAVLAPAAAFRPLLVPQEEAPSPTAIAGCRGGVAAAKSYSGEANEKRCCMSRYYPWAQLMVRVFGFDVLACPRCGARMTILAAIDSPDAIRKILGCLGLPTRAPPIAPAIPDGEAAASW